MVNNILKISILMLCLSCNHNKEYNIEIYKYFEEFNIKNKKSIYILTRINCECNINQLNFIESLDYDKNKISIIFVGKNYNSKINLKIESIQKKFKNTFFDTKSIADFYKINLQKSLILSFKNNVLINKISLTDSNLKEANTFISKYN